MSGFAGAGNQERVLDEASISAAGDLRYLKKTLNGSDISDKGAFKVNLGLVPATVQRFTTPGAGTYTPTSVDVRFIRIRMVGGGGGGCGANASASQTDVGSGGGAGGYVEHIMAAGTYSYSVGAGGAAQSNGGNTTFNSGALVASGGAGTAFNTGSGTTASRASGAGAGGAASGGNIANTPGEHGEIGFRYGGSDCIGARGGASFLSGACSQVVSANGPQGLDYGGGGGGAASSSAGAKTGGAGANGVIIVEEYY